MMLGVVVVPVFVRALVGGAENKDEEIPRLRPQKVIGGAGVLVDVGDQGIQKGLFASFGVSAFGIDLVSPHFVINFGFEIGRIDKVGGGAGREQAGDDDAVDRLDGIGDGDVLDDDFFAESGQEAPNGVALHGARVERHAVEAAGVVALEPPHAAVLAGVLAGHEGRPVGHGRGRQFGQHVGGGALRHEPRQVGHVPGLHPRAGEVPRCAVEGNDHDVV